MRADPADGLLARWPKAEVHLHLDGSLRPATALELGQARGVIERGVTVADLRSRLVAPMPCRDQAELLRAFDLPLALLQDGEALARVAAELVEDVAADGTRYAEVRWAPSLHVRGGLRLPEVIAAVARGTRQGAERVRAAGGDVEVRLIAVAMRSGPAAASAAVARAAVAAAGEGVVGFDLAGPEAAYPDVATHRRAFAIARAGGLGITVHSGEWGGPAQVRRALVVRPDRIAHGAPAADDPALMAELRARGITLDLCPSSNWQAGLVAHLTDHPLPRLARAGVAVTLSTDDRTVSDLTLTREYATALDRLGLSPAELWAIDRHAVEAAFLAHEPGLRDRLRRAFDAFAATEPMLAG
ncbi:MAG: adenosine deaminase [Candidatus Limnocylindrales bacterium]